MTDRMPFTHSGPMPALGIAEALPSAGDPEETSWTGHHRPDGSWEPGLIQSAFGLENTVMGAIDLLSREQYKHDVNHNPLDIIKGTHYEQMYLDRFVTSANEQNTRDIMARIDKEEEQRNVLARSGGWGLVTGMVAGAADPTIIVPLGFGINAAVKGGRGARLAASVAEGAGIGAGVIAGQESLLHASQETRTKEESFAAISMGALLGGILGGYAARIPKTDIDRAARALEGEADPEMQLQDVIDGTPDAADLGAAAADQPGGVGVEGEGYLKDFLGLERGGRVNPLIRQDPLIRGMTDLTASVRNTVRRLADIPYILKDNVRQVSSAPARGAVETRVNLRTYRALGNYAQALNDAFLAYYRRVGGAGGRIGASFARAVGSRRAGGNGLTFKEFDLEIARRMRGEEPTVDIPELESVVSTLRREMDQVFEELKAQRIVPEDVETIGDAAYLNRVYNQEAIRLNQRGFIRALVNHFVEEEVAALPKPPTRAELNSIRALAEDDAAKITRNILNMKPGKMLTFAEFVRDTRGSQKARRLNIPTRQVEDFVSNDTMELLRNYLRTNVPDIELHKEFGSVDLADELEFVTQEYQELALRYDNQPKMQRAIMRRAEVAVRDINQMVSRIRGEAGFPSDPNGWLHRTSAAVRTANFLRLLGGMTISALPDVFRPWATQGFAAAYGVPFKALVKNRRVFKLARENAKLMAGIYETLLNNRAMTIADINDMAIAGSKFEKGLQSMANAFGWLTLMSPWNQISKEIVGVAAMTKGMQLIEKVVRNTATKAETQYVFAGVGGGREMVERIWKQFNGAKGRGNKAHGIKDVEGTGIWLPNIGAWKDTDAADTFSAFVHREVNRTIVTPGMDRPVMMDNEIGRVVGQFRSFGFASTGRTLIAGLQQRDSQVLGSFLASVAMGSAVYAIKSYQAGRELSDDPRKWIVEGIDRSGLLGWLADANNILEKLSRGRVGLSALTGGEMATRFASRNAVGAVLGPTFDSATDMAILTGALAAGDVKASDIHRIRKMIFLQNLFWLRQALNAVEQGAIDGLDLPQQ